MTTPPTNDTLLAAAQRDGQMATAGGETVFSLPDGCSLRDLPCHPDSRGIVCELFDPRWPTLTQPFEFCYYWTIKPQSAKGWAMHKEHEDRYCLIFGEMLAVMYDGRPGSPTFGRTFEIYLSEQRRRMLTIARGVWHADFNSGETDAVIVNFPTIKYDHANPDKYRLPLHTDLIPYPTPTNLKGY